MAGGRFHRRCPSTLNPAYAAALPIWQTCHDAIEGARAIKGERKSVYLPPLPGHEQFPKLYAPYVQRASWYGATGRTFRGLVGLVTRKEADITAPETEAVKPILKDANGAGESFFELTERAIGEVLAVVSAWVRNALASGAHRDADLPVDVAGLHVLRRTDREQRRGGPEWCG